MTSSQLAKNRQAGYTLVELSIVLAVVAAIMVGGLIAARKVYLSTSINNQAKDSAMVISKLQRQYAGRGLTTGMTTNVAAGLGIWPTNRAINKDGSWTVNGVISGTTEWVSANTTAATGFGANSGFIYTVKNVPRAGCSEVVTSMDSLAGYIWVNATTAGAESTEPATMTPTTGQVKGTGAALNMANLGAACASADNVDIAISFIPD
jgi:prepilin-type N-terminal cleavage/methylation domain-containing protein